jgi:PAS domain S-box-containing protein
MNKPIRILYIDDNALDHELVRDALEKEHAGFELVTTASRKELETALGKGGFDLVLSDFNILGFEGLQVLDAVHARDSSLPVVIVTGTGSEELAVEAMKRGAADYVIKTSKHIQHLPQTIQGVLGKKRLEKERNQIEKALREREDHYRDLVENSQDLIYTHDLAGKLLSVNEVAVRLTGYPREALLQMNLTDLLAPDTRRVFSTNLKQVRVMGHASGLMQIQTAGGETRYWEYDNTLRTGGMVIPIVRGMAHDITERRRAEDALRESENKFKNIFESANVGKSITLPTGEIDVNKAFCDLLGYTPEELRNKKWQDITPPDEIDPTQRILDLFLKGEMDSARFTKRYVHKNGSFVWADVSAAICRDNEGKSLYFITTVVDITAQRLMEDQLRQAQKMETVGQLAGGVAHDFNNMLQVIISYTELAMAKVDAELPLHKYLLEIRRAAQRSAEITGQLLAFARKQTVSPKVLDLNEAVAGTQKMIQRLIGEDINLAWMPGRDLWEVKIDPAQLDQILANLAVNARDAIGGVGKLTIETDKVVFDEAYCAIHQGFLPGEYLLLAVSDDGRGMDKETMSHIFEPFFTTKGLGKGTGLGLATVYGIVKQNNGFINVYSEPGQGTTFKVYLPRAEGAGSAERREAEGATLRGGTETLFVVEDEAAILEIAREMLEQLGYTVLSASSPEEAIRMSEEREGSIHLLITDVVMPQMNGRELCERLGAARPGLKCLYMSGYTADVIAHRGVLEEGVSFIAKPFSLTTLSVKVREVLDAPPGNASSAT